MKVRLLGPIEVLAGEGEPPTAVSAPMLRALLAALALRPGQVVPASELIQQLWGQEPPPTARTTLRNYVMRLRKALPEGGIRTAASGYQLLIDEKDTDAGQLRELLRSARRLTAGDPAEALRVLETALGLWRGTPLEDIGDCPLRSTEQARLEELRLSAMEECFELKTALGRHAEIIDELTAAVHANPLRERLARQLILALYRSGRTADALAAYRSVRARLIDELGLEPGLELRRLEEAILRDDPDVRGAAQPARPVARRPAVVRMPGVPPSPSTFVARERELELLTEWLTADEPGPAICLIDGPGGVGKSSLAARAARAAAEHYPDGLLYVDLRGADPRNPAQEPAVVLGQLLTALAVPLGDQPQRLADAVALYRERLRGRRVLLLLDNALDTGQLQPLLPDEPGCAAIVTSRTMLAGPGGRHLHLNRLDPWDAVTLLRTSVGSGNMPEDGRGLAELAQLCGQLPLALRIMATRMAARPQWSVGDWIGVLRQEHGRMDQLRVADLDLRASLMVSIDQLAGSENRVDLLAARIFPRLGVSAIRSHSAQSAAALAGCTPAEAEEALERLTDARITDSPRPGRYTLHDLLRSAAEWQAARLPEQERRQSLAALAAWYLGGLHRTPEALHSQHNYRERADRLLRRFPSAAVFDGPEQAMRWADGVVDDVVALAEQLAVPELDSGTELAGAPLATFAMEAAVAMEPYFGVRMDWRHQERLAGQAMKVAFRHGNREAEGEALAQLGKLAAQRGEFARGEEQLRRAVALFLELDLPASRARARTNLLACIGISGRLTEAFRRLELAVQAARIQGPPHQVVSMLANLAWSSVLLGKLERGREAALEVYRSPVATPYNRMMASGVLAEYYILSGAPEEGARWAEAGLADADLHPLDPQGVAHLHSLLAQALRASGRDEDADDQDREAAAVIDALNRREQSNVRLRLHYEAEADPDGLAVAGEQPRAQDQALRD